MPSIETDWDKIVLEAALTFYKESIKTDVTDGDISTFLKYSDLVKAVSSMKVVNGKDPHLVCSSNCASIVKEIWKKENIFLAEKLGIKAENVQQSKHSAVERILKGLLKGADFRDKNNDQILGLERSNLMADKYDPTMNPFATQKKLLKSFSGGSLSQKATQPWRKELTRRVQQNRNKKK
jgi:hypothetical protein